jgi:hypothetical protein
VVPYSKSTTTIKLPSKWDDNEVTRLLQRYQDQPAVLSHAVSSIKTRLVMNQDIKTAQRRLKLIASVIELFKFYQALQGILYDIHLAEKDFEIRQVEADTRLEDAVARRKSENRLRDLCSQRDELQLQREITQLRRDTESIDRPAKPEAQLTPEQQRAKRHAASEARLESLKQQKQEALKIQDPEERVQKVNAIDDEIQRELQGEWRNSL